MKPGAETLPGFVVSGGMSKPPQLRTMRTTLTAIETRSVKVATKGVAPFYESAAWRGLMRDIIAARGVRCEDPRCERREPPTRVYGDHVIELKDGGAALDPTNIVLRCGACHSRKTAAVRAARLRA